MLVLSRKNGQRVWIGGSIYVEVLEIGPGRVKLGFSAPANMDIRREEIRKPRPAPLPAWRECPAVAEVCV
jgi:carbon storage regulator